MGTVNSRWRYLPLRCTGIVTFIIQIKVRPHTLAPALRIVNTGVKLFGSHGELYHVHVIVGPVRGQDS
jgi:hypothetical protein